MVDPLAVAPANPSLTTEAIALLRAVNVALEGRLTPREHARFVKRELGEGYLASRPGTAARTPASLAEVLLPAAERWGREISEATYAVHGSLADLTPRLADRSEPHPDDVPDGVPDPDEVGALVDEVLRRVRDERVDSAHDGTGSSRGTAGAARRAAGGLWRRLRVRGG